MLRGEGLRTSYWWNRFVASDPDLARLKMGLRAVLGMGLSLGAITVAGRLLHQPTALGLVGVNVGMMAAISVQDPLLPQQRVTQLCMPLVAAVAVCLGALSSAHEVASALLFLGVIFLAVFARRFGPRGMALGMITFMTFFFALFFHASVAQLPWMLASIGIGGAIAYAVRFWLVPDGSNASLRRTFTIFRRTLPLLLADLSSALQVSGSRRWEWIIRHSLRRLHDGAMEVERNIEQADPATLAPGLRKEELREHLLELELSAERLASTLYRLLDWDTLSPEDCQNLRAKLATARRQVRDNHAPSPSLSGPAASATTAVEAALVEFQRVYARPLRSSSGVPLAAATEQPPKESEKPVLEGLHPSTRQAIQATVASGLAIIVGHMVSSTRWYWAVIAAFVVFNRASTQGDILLNAWQRILGTVVGVVAGLLVATAVSGHPNLELLLIFGCVFLSFYMMRVSYAWMAFWLTTLMAALYSLLGRYSPDLLYLRLWETLVGAGFGALVSVVLFPSRTGVRVRKAAAETLRDVASFLDAAATLPRQNGGAAIVERVRKIDAKLREVREAARPLSTRVSLVERETLRLVHALASVVFFARQLAHACSRRQADAERVHQLEVQLAESARSLAATLEGEQSGAALAPTEPPQVTPERLPRSEHGDTRTSPLVLHWLKRMDDALVEIRELLSVIGPRRLAR
ncbi:FUSC family protein [Hyalangium rubrum]|uniref:FUSC family protein n=1 Tax=Hyalangium rubrum TaxID=3103134 RepID=A0ABU5H7C2_9BACT|nr:FUSC family protein [Hyalangium sp. s54d21]MDY7229384.1 FUSC family protein [Hyalangium sp. s54d21]